MSSLVRHQTDKVGVFYVLGKPRAKSRGDTATGKPDKIFYIMYRLDGKKIEEKVGRESERMTAAKAAKIRERCQPAQSRAPPHPARAGSGPCGRWTIARLWEAYKANKPDLKGIVTDENRYKNYLQDFASRTPDEISTHDVDALRLRLAKARKKAGTVKNVLELLRRIINFGVKKGLCPWQSPAQLHFEMPRLNNVKTEMLTAEERARFIDAARNAHNRKAGQFMLMAYYTGMRRGELFRLKWTHIDFERGFITIKGEEQEGAKINRDERIPLTQPVRELLAEIGSNDSAYVFPGRDGVSRMTDINKQVNAIKKAANLPADFRPLHGLRHTFASVAVSNGVPLSHVQKLLTHKDPSLTQRYAHLEDSALKNSASLVGDFLANSVQLDRDDGNSQ